MEQGIISKEFYIGRYIYLKSELEKLPPVSFNHMGGELVIAIVSVDPATGKKRRTRISEANPQWSLYYDIAVLRTRLTDQLKALKNNWKSDYTDSLETVSSDYYIVPNRDNRFNSSMWKAGRNNENTYEIRNPVKHNSIIMRSIFESDVAELLEGIGIEYKYESGVVIRPDLTLYPDFSLHFPEYNRCSFLEALGGLDSFKYCKNNAWKIQQYFNAGLYPNRDIAFISGDESYRPDHLTMKRIIGVMADAMARQYVVKKGSSDTNPYFAPFDVTI